MAYIPFKTGTSTFNGDNTTSVVTIPHGLGIVPNVVIINNLSPLSSNLLNRTITYDTTNIVITFGLAPLTGENSTYHWVVYR